MRKRLALLGAAVAVAAAVAVPLAFGASAAGFLSQSDRKQHDRLFRDGTPSICHGKVNPGLFGDNVDRSYDKYSFVNTATSTKCVHVTLQHGCTDGGTQHINAFATAHSAFVPTNPSANYLGDAGQSGTPESFSFHVGAGQSYDVVVSQVDWPLTTPCPYLMRVTIGGSQQTPVAMVAGATD